ncbi:PAS domain S-box protein [Chloroflexota bacterium]
MKDKDKTKEQLIDELDKMRQRISTLEAENHKVHKSYKSIMDACPDLIAVIDKEWNIVNVNNAMSQRFGKRREELIGTNGRNLLPPELSKSRYQYFKEVLQTGEPCRFEDENQGMYFDNIAYPVLQEQGETKQIAIIARDINEHRQANERFQLLTEATFEGIAIHDLGILIEANNQYFRIFGYEPDE